MSERISAGLTSMRHRHVVLLGIALFALAACQEPVSPTPTRTPRRTPLPSPPRVAGELLVTTSQSTYASGETVVFTITNATAQTMYLHGCWPPLPYWIEDGELVPLVTDITESVKTPAKLPAGQSARCTWDQRAWQNLDKQGAARFRELGRNALVPPGEYQLMLYYQFSREALADWRQVRAAYSPSVVVR